MGAEVWGQKGLWTLADSLQELGELARSAGARVVGTMSHRLKTPTNSYVGKGKLEELKDLSEGGMFDTVVCDDELRPTQQLILEKALGENTKVIDRTALVLDVFANRAQTREGRLQVDLAQHEYLLPRLAGQWSHLERLGGGIGTRGPGETQIETDRRLVRNRILRLKKSLEDVRRHRGQYRARRRQQGLPVASLVGYTNAGKSTLLNSLTGATVGVQDRLFSTLDPVTRQLRLDSGREVLVTDTVGLIQKLPPTVVAAFRATLEEIQESAIIVKVVDVSHPNASLHSEVVDGVLGELGVADKPRLLVLNKADLVEVESPSFASSHTSPHGDLHPNTVLISALTGLGLPTLRQELDGLLAGTEPANMVAATPAG